MEPWLPLGDDWRVRIVENLHGDDGSIYNLYRRLIAVRREHPALQLGSYCAVQAQGDLLLYIREWRTERLLMALNLSGRSIPFAHHQLKGEVIVSSRGDRDGYQIGASADLRAEEGLIIALASDAMIL